MGHEMCSHSSSSVWCRPRRPSRICSSRQTHHWNDGHLLGQRAWELCLMGGGVPYPCVSTVWACAVCCLLASGKLRRTSHPSNDDLPIKFLPFRPGARKLLINRTSLPNKKRGERHLLRKANTKKRLIQPEKNNGYYSTGYPWAPKHTSVMKYLQSYTPFASLTFPIFKFIHENLIDRGGGVERKNAYLSSARCAHCMLRYL